MHKGRHIYNHKGEEYANITKKQSKYKASKIEK